MDPCRFFNLTYATAEKPEEAVDDIDEIEPNSTATIDQEFAVNDNVMEFSDGFLTLELLLADPVTGNMRPIQRFQMRMQISGVYQLSHDPAYLLVINSGTPNHAIHQIIGLLRHRLQTKLDIFNISLEGSYESPVTKQNVLKSYTGKSVIVFGNTFNYFSTATKAPWELLDPWETSLLLKAGTSLLFANVAQGSLAGLQAWAKHGTFPAHSFAAGDQSVNEKDAKTVTLALRQAGPEKLNDEVAAHRYPVVGGGMNCFSSIDSAVNSSATTAAKVLSKNMPLRRFVVVPDAEALSNGAGKAGGVIICEGIPRTAKMIATSGYFAPSAPGTNAISDYDMYFIVSCLPFAVRARMFWNIVGQTSEVGATCESLYAGVDGFMSPAAKGVTAPFIDNKVRLFTYP